MIEVREHEKGGWGVWRDGVLVTRTFELATAEAFADQQDSAPAASKRVRPIKTGVGA